MNVVGVEFLQSQLSQPGFAAKLVFNHKGAIFFPITQEHRDQKAPGISYADDYAGNALAAMIAPGKIEVRNHRDFSETRVAEIVQQLLQMPGLAALADFEVTYRGKRVR